MSRFQSLGACLALLAAAGGAQAQGSAETAAMTNARLEQLVRRLDPDAKGRPGFWHIVIEQREVLVIADEAADRMRIMTPVSDVERLDRQALHRLMQANFDTALDARYAIGQGMLWSAFIRPLASLRDTEFLAGVGQVMNLALTFGTAYSSGLLTFQGGDSAALQRRELIDRLLEKGRGP
jgi:hypothetical protein